MVNCHHGEALNYKFEHKGANKSLSNAQQWLSASNKEATKLPSTQFVGSQATKITRYLTVEVDIESSKRTYIPESRTHWQH